MKDFSIEVESSSMVLARQITGTLVVKLGDQQFPTEGWNDFVVIVLGWWSREMRDVIAGKRSTLLFMDGPYHLLVKPTSHDRRSVSLMRDGAVRGEGEVALSTLVDMVLSAAGRTLDECRNRGWVTKEVEELSRERDGLLGAVAGS